MSTLSASPSVRVRRATVSAPLPRQNLGPINSNELSISPKRMRASTISRLYLEEGINNNETRKRADTINSRNGEHEDDEVDLLDVLDTSVSATTHLKNIGSAFLPNSFFPIPPICDLDTETTPITRVITEEEEDPLDAHLYKLLKRQKRKEKIKLAWIGLLQFLKTPLGWIAAIYGFLVVVWGAGLVLILIIPFQDSYTKSYWIEISSQMLTALFTLTGVGLIPMRLKDTINISIIYSYSRRTREKRQKAGLSKLSDKNEISEMEPVLSEKEKIRLVEAQTKFVASQSWYRPHESLTHHAYPISTALIITLLVDLNSLFQCLLCGVMWGYAYPNNHWLDRPPALTAIFIVCSFGCGLGAAILIGVAGEKSKKKKEVTRKVWKMLKEEEERVEREKKEQKELGLTKIVCRIEETV